MYLNVTEIKEAFARHLMQYRGADLRTARLISSEFPEVLKNTYLIEKFRGNVEIDGVHYEKYADRVNFKFFPDHLLPPFEGETPEFCFYTYYNIDGMARRLMRDYARAERIYRMDDLDPADFEDMDSFM